MSHAASLQNHNSSAYAKHASFVYSAANTSGVLGLLDARPGERIIDLGCGTGQLTETIRALVGAGGSVVGVDSSSSMLAGARASPGSGDIVYLQADVQKLEATLDPALAGTFDKVFSSATFHWCKTDPVGVMRGVAWLLKPGGKIAFELGGFGNTVGLRAAVHRVLRDKGVDPVPLDPWYFPTVAQYSTVIEQAGLVPEGVALYPRPTAINTDIKGWLETFARNTFFKNFSAAEADDLMAQVQEECRIDGFWHNATPGMGVKPSAEGAQGEQGWEVMYVRLRGVAVKPQ